MDTTRPILITSITGVLVALAGCADKNIERQPRVDTRPMVGEIRQAELDWAWIARQQWDLATIEGGAPIEGSSAWIRFREHTWLEGDAGCNRFTASYERKAEAGLQVSQILSTRMFCAFPEGVMQQEARIFHLLQTIDAYHAEPDRLDLRSDGATVLTFTIQSSDDEQP